MQPVPPCLSLIDSLSQILLLLLKLLYLNFLWAIFVKLIFDLIFKNVHTWMWFQVLSLNELIAVSLALELNKLALFLKVASETLFGELLGPWRALVRTLMNFCKFNAIVSYMLEKLSISVFLRLCVLSIVAFMVEKYLLSNHLFQDLIDWPKFWALPTVRTLYQIS